MKARTRRALLDGREVSLAILSGSKAPPAGVEQALNDARSEGCALALVVSTMAAAGALPAGFVLLPASETACYARMPVPWPKEPKWVEAGELEEAVPGLRPARPADLEGVAAIHDASTAAQRFRILRDRPIWDRLLRAPKARGSASGGRSARVEVIEKGSTAVAYAVLVETPAALVVKEHGAAAGESDRLVDLFWVALARARRAGLLRLEGWHFPPAVAAKGLYPVARRARASPALLLRSLDPALDLPTFTVEDECRVGALDLP